MKYSTTIKLNNIGYDELLQDIVIGRITDKQWEEVNAILTREQRDDLRNELWDRGCSRLLDKEDCNIMDYMNPTEKIIYSKLTDISDDLPF